MSCHPALLCHAAKSASGNRARAPSYTISFGRMKTMPSRPSKTIAPESVLLPFGFGIGAVTGPVWPKRLGPWCHSQRLLQTGGTSRGSCEHHVASWHSPVLEACVSVSLPVERWQKGQGLLVQICQIPSRATIQTMHLGAPETQIVSAQISTRARNASAKISHQARSRTHPSQTCHPPPPRKPATKTLFRFKSANTAWQNMYSTRSLKKQN